MDVASRIETLKASYRLLYASDVAALRAKIATLQEDAEDEVNITSSNFAESGSAGQVSNEPTLKLAAALAVLAELDTTAAAILAGPGKGRFADFSQMGTET